MSTPFHSLFDDKLAEVTELQDEEAIRFNQGFPPGTKWYRWYCPTCRAENIDSPDLTTIPLCANCEGEWDW